MKRILELVGRTLPLVFLVAHCATNADSGSQTHWVACKTDVDCDVGPCVEGRCASKKQPSEAGPGPTDARPCPDGQHLAYETPGCGATVRPTCVGPYLGFCLAEACGCDGVTFLTGCGKDRPFAHTGPCEDGALDASPKGDGRVTWVGPPCSECDLPTQVARLADPASEDCGVFLRDAGDASYAARNECARAAFQAGRPFTVIFEQFGTDSYISTSVVFTGGQLYEVRYDSNVCGGAASCDSPGCGPSVTWRTCVGPVVSNVSDLFDCTSLTEQQAICGPSPG